MHIDDPSITIEHLNQLDFFDLKKYEIVDILYSSNSSSVYSYAHKHTKEKVAVKEIRLKDIDMESLYKHLDQLQKIKLRPHLNIIEVKGFCLMRKQKFVGEDLSALIIMELATQSLADWIQHKSQQANDYFTTDQVVQFLFQIVGALEFLQIKHQTAHQDLKPENILISADLQTFKLADMDEVKFQGSTKTQLQQIYIGTPEYQAPEIQKAIKQVKSTTRYNPYKADVYSLGLCLLYMTTFKSFSISDRNTYYNDKQLYEQTLKKLRQTIKVRYSRVIAKVIKCMLESDPFKRVDFHQLKKIITQNLTQVLYQQPADDESNNSSNNCNQSGSSSSQNIFKIGQNEEEIHSKTQTLSNTILDENNFDLQKSMLKNRDTINEEDYYYIAQQEDSKQTSGKKKQKEKDSNKSFNNPNEKNIPYNGVSSQQKAKSSIRYRKEKELQCKITQNHNNNIIAQNGRAGIGGSPQNHLSNNNSSNNLLFNKQHNMTSPSLFNQQKQTNNNVYNQLPHDGSASDNNQDEQNKFKEQKSTLNVKKIAIQIFIFLTVIVGVFCLIYFLSNDGYLNSENQGSSGSQTNCPANQFHLRSQCVSQCPSNYYVNQNSNDCILCNQQCKQCINGSSNTDCTACETGYYLLMLDQRIQTGLCVHQCPGNAMCKVCIFNCSTCSQDQLRCIACNQNMYLYMGFCVSQCPTPYQEDKTTGSCRLNITLINKNQTNSELISISNANKYNYIDQEIISKEESINNINKDQ